MSGKSVLEEMRTGRLLLQLIAEKSVPETQSAMKAIQTTSFRGKLSEENAAAEVTAHITRDI
jgi:hypothetical protein